MAKAAIIEVSGSIQIREVKDGEIGKIVGGLIELLPFGKDASAYINEEGKLMGLKTNPLATKLARERKIGLARDDFIVGPMVVFGLGSPDGEETDVTDSFIATLPKANIL